MGIRRRVPAYPVGGGAFSDDFNDGSLSAFWQTSGSTITEGSGYLQISGSSSAHIRSVSPYDFTTQTVSCQFLNVPGASLSYAQQLIIADGDSFTNHYIVQVYAGDLQFQHNGSVDFSVAYNATNHAYVRLRTNGTTIFFEASTDGASWSTLYSEAFGITMTSLYVFLRSFAFASCTHRWDNFVSTLV